MRLRECTKQAGGELLPSTVFKVAKVFRHLLYDIILRQQNGRPFYSISLLITIYSKYFFLFDI